MKSIVFAILACATAFAAQAETENFDSTSPGALPESWEAGVTGSGNSRWAVGADPTAPSGKNVLQQTGRGTFPWCVKKNVSLAGGFVEVKFKPLSGKEDRAGGVLWRWKDGNNYYVARANVWHTLRVEFKDQHISVLLDGKRHIDLDDTHIAGPGAVGVWTKADSVTSFDDFSYGTF